MLTAREGCTLSTLGIERLFKCSKMILFRHRMHQIAFDGRCFKLSDENEVKRNESERARMGKDQGYDNESPYFPFSPKIMLGLSKSPETS